MAARRAVAILALIATLGAADAVLLAAGAEPPLPAGTICADNEWAVLADGSPVTCGGVSHVIGTDAFDTIGEAVTAAPSGGTVYVAPGDYTEHVAIIGRTLTILGPQTALGPSPTADRPAAADEARWHPAGGEALSVSGGSVHVEGISFLGAVVGDKLVDFDGGASHVFSHNQLLDTPDAALTVTHTIGVTVSNNVVRNNRSGVVFGAGNSNVTISGNVTAANNQSTPASLASAIFVDGGVALADRNSNVLIEGNVSLGGALAQGTFIGASEVTGLTIRNNTAADTMQAAIFIGGNANTVEISGNTISGSWAAIAVCPDHTCTTATPANNSAISITGNTFTGNETAIGLSANAATDTVEVHGNTFTGNGVAVAVDASVRVDVSGNTWDGARFPRPGDLGGSGALFVDTGFGYQPLVPRRIVDTRDGTGPLAAPLTPGTVLQVPIIGQYGVPAGATGVVVNLTATNPSAAGYLTLFPCGPTPYASNLNYVDQPIANLVVVGLGDGGAICVTTFVTTDVVIDLSGWFGAGPDVQFVPADPVRIADTRDNTGGVGSTPLAANAEVTVPVIGHGGVPADATAVAISLTITEPAAAGYATVYPCGANPYASNLNYVAGQNVPNAAVVAVGDGGAICVSTSQTADVIVDITGWYAPLGYQITPEIPIRVADTRDGFGGVPVAKVAAGGVLQVQAVPDEFVGSVAGVVVNLTATNALGDGYLTAYECGGTPPNASNVNYVAGDGLAVASAAFVRVDDNGFLCVRSFAVTDIVVDLTGLLHV